MSVVFAPNPGIPTVTVTGSSQQMSVMTRYIANNPTTRINFTLPVSAAVGDQLFIRGRGAGGWKLSQNANQYVLGSSQTTTGTSGSLQSQAYTDTLTLECTVANTEFLIINSRGTVDYA